MKVRPKNDRCELWYGSIYKAHIALYHSQQWEVVRWKNHQYVTLRRNNITMDVTREDYLRIFKEIKE